MSLEMLHFMKEKQRIISSVMHVCRHRLAIFGRRSLRSSWRKDGRGEHPVNPVNNQRKSSQGCGNYKSKASSREHAWCVWERAAGLGEWWRKTVEGRTMGVADGDQAKWASWVQGRTLDFTLRWQNPGVVGRGAITLFHVSIKGSICLLHPVVENNWVETAGGAMSLGEGESCRIQGMVWRWTSRISQQGRWGWEIRGEWEKTPGTLTWGCAGKASLGNRGAISLVLTEMNLTCLLDFRVKTLRRQLVVSGLTLQEKWRLGIDK